MGGRWVYSETQDGTASFVPEQDNQKLARIRTCYISAQARSQSDVEMVRKGCFVTEIIFPIELFNLLEW